MKETIQNVARMGYSKAVAAVALVAAFVSVGQGIAHADAVSDAFASAQTSIEGYIGTGVGVIAAVLVLGIGVAILVKYVRKAARAA